MSTRGSDASRPTSRAKSVMAPSSSTPSISRENFQTESLSSGLRKRKRDSTPFSLEELLKPVITIRPQFSLGPERPSTLKPLMLLSREHLELSSLDLSAPNGEFPAGPGRFFESHIRVLDLEGRLQQAPSVLLARSEISRNVYAIERHQNGLYVVCKLGAWVNIEKLSHQADASYEQRCRPTRTTQVQTAEAPSTTPQLHKENKRKRLAIEELQSLVRKRPRTMSVPISDPLQSQNHLQAPPPTANDEVSQSTVAQHSQQEGGGSKFVPQSSQSGNPDPTTDVQASAEDIFQNIRSQYSEALYHSKGSLAYFAKGPLSRARAAFHLDCDATLEMKDLVDFLKTLVMTTSQIDKKYRATLPELVSNLKILVESSDDGASKPKRRKPRKLKLGKDGLYPGEVDHIKRWWKVNKPRIEDDNAIVSPGETKYHITHLRTRETQLQMIIILEILALEAVRPAETADDSQLPGMPADDKLKETIETSLKKRNKHNLPTLVDIHADRLCIWQSTTLDEMKMIAAESQANNESGSQKPERVNSDPLKDFCIDILLPFFAGRLPELCETLNHKFGGPVVISPPEPKKHVTAAAPMAPAKPGSAAKRPAPVSAPRSLEKVLSNDQLKRRATRRPNDILARMRSATPATIPGLKREASEPVALNTIPHGDKVLKERSRNITSRSVSSVSVENMKAQKKAKTEAELKEAILALKKPNRQLVGMTIAEEAEKRAGSSSSPRPRKSKKPVPRFNAASKPQVQVKATPVNYRFKDAMPAVDQRKYGSLNLPLPKADLGMIPSSSIVPSTAPRQALRADLEAFHIASTPVAKRAKANTVPDSAMAPHSFNPTSNDASIQHFSPSMYRKSTSANQPYLTAPGGDIAPSSPVLPRLFETPIKQRSSDITIYTDDVFHSTPPEPRRAAVLFATPIKKSQTSAPTAADRTATKENEKPAPSIYQQLGWDDYDVSDLA
ncbi:hypothetical protein VPNG_09703 [Cytospora leucostoma]|uniref:DNA replication regulator Sld3 C-terminal domain-containing protein n=1 Tax=Cytospora leucostoma TaxID=1230097 RepID=A0A423VJR0_9PEZI|nr:hypothetical protein VPNG_09703 [Cytospora leucostoma]